MLNSKQLWLLLTVVAFSAVISAQTYTCDDSENNKAVCECKADADGCCYFKFTIEHLQTFTAYERDAPLGTRGRIYEIIENRTLSPVRNGSDLPCDDEGTCTMPNTVDGSSYRSFISINKQMPGPTLIVNEGAIIVVDVINNLATEETSIHWHGMHQRNTPWMDGVGYITQCPIEAGASFRYIFRATPPGTHWYHSHSGAQRTDGLFGALIVKERDVPDDLEEFEDIPGDHTLTLLDWQRESSLDLFVQIHSSLGYYENIRVDQVPVPNDARYTSTCSADGAEVGPIPYWSGLINGLGKHRDIDFMQSRLNVFHVEMGSTYRFRLIGAQANYAYRFSIHGHKLTLIATDGHFIQPIPTDYIIIHTGERYDFLLKANETGEHFLIRAETLETSNSLSECGAAMPKSDIIALLTYNSSLEWNNIDTASIVKIKEQYMQADPRGCSEDNNCIVTNCPFENYPDGSYYACINVDKFKPLEPNSPGLEAFKDIDIGSTMFFNFGFDSNEFTSTINGRNFILPSVSLQTDKNALNAIAPKLCTDLNDTCDESDADCQCIHITEITDSLENKRVRFVLSSLGVRAEGSFPFAHPVHLHGHSFRVVGVGYGEYNDVNIVSVASSDLDCDGDMPCRKPPKWKNNTVPREIQSKRLNETILKDTVIVPAGGYVVVEIVANNPGYWFMHCHIESHQLEGMALVVNELMSKQKSPPDGMATCGDFTWDVEDFKKIAARSTGSSDASNDDSPATNRVDEQPYICDNELNNQAVCECTENECYFKFVIEHLQTFTAYQREAPLGTRGRIFNIDTDTASTVSPVYVVPNQDQPCNNLGECSSPNTVDGSSYRSFISINKQMPGPTLIVNEGAIVVVDVINNLATEETSIHWHGMHQRNTPWMDGVGYITQCPIEAGASFRYIFRATPSGTHWYHSHSGAQRTDGLFGTLIVMEKEIPSALPDFEDYPDDHTLTLLDWQRESSLDLFVQIHSSLGYYEDTYVDEVPTQDDTRYTPTCSVDGAEVGPIPYWSGIISGLGKHANINFPNSRLNVFIVERAKTYRFRLIGAQANYAYRFSIDGHRLTLIASDGHFIEPIPTDYIIIHTGERYDFLLTADQTGEDFIIRAESLEFDFGDSVDGCSDFMDRNDAVALLSYNPNRKWNNNVDFNAIQGNYNNINPKGCSAGNLCTVTNCPFENYPDNSGYTCTNVNDFRPLFSRKLIDYLVEFANTDIGSTMFFNFGFDSNEFTSTINGRNFILPSISLQTDESGLGAITNLCTDLDNTCDESDCQCVHITEITDSMENKRIRFVLSSLGVRAEGSFPFAHPVHLHGHSFRVVGVGYGEYNKSNMNIVSVASADLDCDGDMPCRKAPRWKDGIVPYEIESKPISQTVLKDTVIVPAGGYVVVEIVANNPGYWFMHCHIESHQLEGMALVVNELSSKHNPPPAGLPTCQDFTWSVAEFSGTAKLGVSLGALVISVFVFAGFWM